MCFERRTAAVAVAVDQPALPAAVGHAAGHAADLAVAVIHAAEPENWNANEGTDAEIWIETIILI